MNPITNWSCKKFNILSPYELYAIMQLRNEDFVVEQICVFQDADNKDFFCFHLMGWHQTTLVAYTRIMPPGISYSESSIGRVVTSPRYRQSGIGKWLMQKSVDLKYSIALYNTVPSKDWRPIVPETLL